MAYQVLARKYRPQRFADVAGQEHVTVTLMNALRQQRIAHGYIFSGHRGIGKTTIARILAMALNCRNAIGSEVRPTPEPCLDCVSCREISNANRTEEELSALQMQSAAISNLDYLEIDAATNRGIEEVKRLIDTARVAPAGRNAGSRYRIITLDEAHQLTDAAWNALLKTLEEPAPWIVFMFATTQPEDIPQTVRSRCQHFNFHAVKMVDILNELRGIAAREGVEADDAALSLLAEAGDGSMRDALSVMDQAIASAPVEAGRAVLSGAQIRELMGTVSNAIFERLLEAVDGGRSAEVITLANELMDAGNSPSQLARQCVRYLRNVLMAKVAELTPETAGEDGTATEILQISPDERRRAARTAAHFTEEELTRYMQVMLRTFDELGYRQEQRFHFELGLLKLVHLRRLLPMEELLSQLPVTTGKSAGSRPNQGVAAASSVKGASEPVRAGMAAARDVPVARTAEAGASAKPVFSPFAVDSQRKRFEDGGTAIKAATSPAVANAIETPSVPVPLMVTVAASAARTETVKAARAETTDVTRERLGRADVAPEALTTTVERASVPRPTEEHAVVAPAFVDGDAVKPVAAVPDGGGARAEVLRQAVIEALLQSGKQTSAGEALEDAEWRVEDGVLRVQTGYSKAMLGMVLNPDAEKIARAAIREAGGVALKVEWLPGVAAEKKPGAPKRVARSGSAQAKAEEHPIVKQAQELFHAEIRKVIDLSGK